MAAHSIVPIRFLSLMAHLVITIMLFWSREANILACVSSDVTIGSSQYTSRDRELLVAFSLSLACLLVEVVGLVSGLSMFSSLTSLFSIAVHVSASIVLSMYVVNSWPCRSYWYVFGFCCFVPFVLELCVIAHTLKCKVFVNR